MTKPCRSIHIYTENCSLLYCNIVCQLCDCEVICKHRWKLCSLPKLKLVWESYGKSHVDLFTYTLEIALFFNVTWFLDHVVLKSYANIGKCMYRIHTRFNWIKVELLIHIFSLSHTWDQSVLSFSKIRLIIVYGFGALPLFHQLKSLRKSMCTTAHTCWLLDCQIRWCSLCCKIYECLANYATN